MNKRSSKKLCKRPQKKARIDIDTLTDASEPAEESKLTMERRCLGKEWVSASSLYNYMTKDPIIDWLNEYGDTLATGATGATSAAAQKLSDEFAKIARGDKTLFGEHILSEGVRFEDKIVQNLSLKHHIVKVSDHFSVEACKKTIELMKEGVPIIHSAPVMNEINKTYGTVDLLVRSDYLGKLVRENPLLKIEEVYPAPFLQRANRPPKGAKSNARAGAPHTPSPSKKTKGQFHYIVIDIKWSTVPLRADGRLILNTRSYPAYKAQLYIYTQAVGLAQGYTCNNAYVMGRGWNYCKSDRSYAAYIYNSKLGSVEFSLDDYAYVKKVNDGIKWIRDVRFKGSTWDVLNPHRWELYPNMCKPSLSNTINGYKKIIAKHIGEISMIWYCGVQQRENALKEGISSWRDPKCTPSILGFKKSGMRYDTIGKILSINQQVIDQIRPRKLVKNKEVIEEKNVEFYVDFETFSEIFDKSIDESIMRATDDVQESLKFQKEMIFMIGVGWEDEFGWQYHNITCTEPTPEEEYRIMKEFRQLIGEDDILIHWSRAEPQFWKRAVARHTSNDIDGDKISSSSTLTSKIFVDQLRWRDLCDVFQDEPIVIRGCYNFKLKSVACAMKENKLIDDEWDSSVDNGLDAMIAAWNYYSTSSEDNSAMVDIIKYNNADCRLMWRIMTYLRNNLV